jgi:hypothetical protein
MSLMFPSQIPDKEYGNGRNVDASGPVSLAVPMKHYSSDTYRRKRHWKDADVREPHIS